MNKLFLTTLIGLFAISLTGQTPLSLSEALEIAADKSVQTKINQNQFVGGQLDYDIFRKSMLPSFTLTSTLPNLNRSLDKITLPDGSDSYVQRSQMVSNVGLNVNQPLVWTGGNIYFNTSLERIDLFGNNRSTNYLGTPISIGFSQNLFGFNPFRWSRKIAPINFEVAEKLSVENAEDVSITTVQLYYEWLLADIQYELAKNFQSHNDTIYQISQGRFEMGKIAENDLLQAELNSLNSNIDVKQSELRLQVSKMRLEQYINQSLDNRNPLVDTVIREINVPIMQAVELAQQNLSTYEEYERQLIQANREVARARSNNSPTINVFASFGLTQSAVNPEDVYQNPTDRELVVVEMDVPLYQFGFNKAQTDRAKVEQQIIQDQIQLDQQRLEQTLYERITNFTLLQEQVKIAKRADVVANKGYTVTRQRFMIGKIDLLELNQAVTRKTSSRIAYINALRDYWTAFFEIRKLTHYDFENDKMIVN